MKNARKIFVLLCGLGVIYSITAASDQSNENSRLQNKKNVSSELNSIITSEQQNECFDLMMAEWFNSFNQFQQNGNSISEADEKASEIAVEYYGKCD